MDLRTRLAHGRLTVLTLVAVGVAVAMSGCTGSTGDGADPTSAGETPTDTAAPTLESRLLSVAQLPGEGWMTVPPATAAEPESAGTDDVTTVCQGNLKDVIGIPSNPVTGSFARDDLEFTEQIIPSDDPMAAVENLREAVSGCFGMDTPMSNQDATLSFEPLPDSGDDDSTFGAVTNVNTNSGLLSVPFMIAAVGDALVFTQTTAPQGTAIDIDEFVQLSGIAADAAVA